MRSCENLTSLTALSRNPGIIDVWWFGLNDSVQGAYWEEGERWTRYELASKTPTIKVSKQNGTIIVTGTDFKPGSILIRLVVEIPSNEYSIYIDPVNGSFTTEIDVSWIPKGTNLYISATNGTRVPTSQDITGFLWSKTVPITL